MKKDILRKLSDENNGYLFTAEVLSQMSCEISLFLMEKRREPIILPNFSCHHLGTF